MKKNFFIFLSLTFLFPSAYAQDSLKNIINELNYSLNIEWDQKDQTFYQEKLFKFQNNILELYKAGTSKEEIFAELINTIPDQKIANDLEETLNLISISNLSNQEASDLILNSSHHSQTQGAQWAGTVAIVAVSLIVVVVATTALLLHFASNNPSNCSYVCDSNYNDDVCNLEWTCN